jgi:hypothetical protein
MLARNTTILKADQPLIGYFLASIRSGWRDLNSRPLDPQSLAKRTYEFTVVRLPWSQRFDSPRVSPRTPANGSPWLHTWLHGLQEVRL